MSVLRIWQSVDLGHALSLVMVSTSVPVMMEPWPLDLTVTEL